MRCPWDFRSVACGRDGEPERESQRVGPECESRAQRTVAIESAETTRQNGIGDL